MSGFEDFPSKRKVLSVKDISDLNRMIGALDSACGHRRNLIKIAMVPGSPFDPLGNMNHMGEQYGRVHKYIDPDVLTEIQETFRNSIVEELNRFIDQSVQHLKKEYGVLYDEQENRNNDFHDYTSR